jgi:DNA-binding MarR family transcriptional regulator
MRPRRAATGRIERLRGDGEELTPAVSRAQTRPMTDLEEAQTRPMTDLEEIGKACFALHARMTARLLSRVYDAAMRPADLRLAQFGLLGAIAHGSNPSETALAERLGLERTTLVRNLKLLTEKGWIEPLSGDGRGVRHRLTEAGREKLESAIPLWEAAQRRIEDKLGEVEP